MPSGRGEREPDMAEMADKATIARVLVGVTVALWAGAAGCEGSLTAASNPATSPADLTRLAADHDAEVRKAVAGNPSTPGPVLAATYASSLWRPVIAANPGISPELLVTIFIENIDGGYYSAHDGGSHSAAPILAALAANPATPIDILYDLAEESDEVGATALENPKLMTGEARARLVETSIHLQTARDHPTSPLVLSEPAADTGTAVRPGPCAVSVTTQAYDSRPSSSRAAKVRGAWPGAIEAYWLAFLHDGLAGTTSGPDPCPGACPWPRGFSMLWLRLCPAVLTC